MTEKEKKKQVNELLEAHAELLIKQDDEGITIDIKGHKITLMYLLSRFVAQVLEDNTFDIEDLMLIFAAALNEADKEVEGEA